MTTLHMISSVVEHLKRCFPALAIENFPEKPAEYRLNHPAGALLVSFAGSRFSPSRDTHAIAQERTITLSITVVVRQLNGSSGAVDVLDKTRQALLGFKPANCKEKLSAISEHFLGESAGLWQYALDLKTSDMQMEDLDELPEPHLSHITTHSEFGNREILKQADGSISIQEN